MSTLPDEEVIEIAKANDVNFTDLVTAPFIDSTGSVGVEIKIILTPGSSAKIRGGSARTKSQVMQWLVDAGENVFRL
jgi:hypothetical protein